MSSKLLRVARRQRRPWGLEREMACESRGFECEFEEKGSERLMGVEEWIGLVVGFLMPSLTRCPGRRDLAWKLLPSRAWGPRMLEATSLTWMEREKDESGRSDGPV